MVMVKRMKKYTTKMGQNTGTSNTEKNVHTMEISTALVALTLWWVGPGRECGVVG